MPTLAGDLLLGGLPFTAADARGHGISRPVLRELVATGQVRHAPRGVYLDARLPDDVLHRARCVARVLPPRAAVARLTAAWLYGIDGRSGPLEEPLSMECVVPPGTEPPARSGVRGYIAPLDSDIRLVDGVPCTTPERTAVDLLRWGSPHTGLAVADALAATGTVTRRGLLLDVDRFKGGRGVARARRLAGFVDPRTESFGESWTRLRLLDAGFPVPELQIEIRSRSGRPVARLDMGWPGRLLAVEYDGAEYHSSPAQLDHDRRRREALERIHGWRVVPVGKGEILGRSMRFEVAVGELLGLAPALRARSW